METTEIKVNGEGAILAHITGTHNLVRMCATCTAAEIDPVNGFCRSCNKHYSCVLPPDSHDPNPPK